MLNDSSLSINQLGNTNSFINYGGLITLENDANATINVERKMTAQDLSNGFCVMNSAQLTIQAKSFVFNTSRNTTYSFSLGGPSYSPDPNKWNQYRPVTSNTKIVFGQQSDTSCIFYFVNKSYPRGLFNFITKNPKYGNYVENCGQIYIYNLRNDENLKAFPQENYLIINGKVIKASDSDNYFLFIFTCMSEYGIIAIII